MSNSDSISYFLEANLNKRWEEESEPDRLPQPEVPDVSLLLS